MPECGESVEGSQLAPHEQLPLRRQDQAYNSLFLSLEVSIDPTLSCFPQYGPTGPGSFDF